MNSSMTYIPSGQAPAQQNSNHLNGTHFNTNHLPVNHRDPQQAHSAYLHVPFQPPSNLNASAFSTGQNTSFEPTPAFMSACQTYGNPSQLGYSSFPTGQKIAFGITPEALTVCQPYDRPSTDIPYQRSTQRILSAPPATLQSHHLSPEGNWNAQIDGLQRSRRQLVEEIDWLKANFSVLQDQWTQTFEHARQEHLIRLQEMERKWIEASEQAKGWEDMAKKFQILAEERAQTTAKKQVSGTSDVFPIDLADVDNSGAASSCPNPYGDIVQSLKARSLDWLGPHPLRSPKKPQPYGPGQAGEERDNTPQFGSLMSTADGTRSIGELQRQGGTSARKIRQPTKLLKPKVQESKVQKAKVKRDKIAPKVRHAATSM